MSRWWWVQIDAPDGAGASGSRWHDSPADAANGALKAWENANRDDARALHDTDAVTETKVLTIKVMPMPEPARSKRINPETRRARIAMRRERER